MTEIIVQHTQLNYDSSTKVEVGVKGTVCRFCKSPDASFKNLSHSIPEFLGNKSVFTVDECDACNSIFGEGIESHLSKFIPSSWMTRIKGKKGFNKVELERGVKIYSDENFLRVEFSRDYKYEDRLIELKIKGSKFSPLNVYKAFVKILVSLMPNEYLHEFNEIILWLRSDSGFEDIHHKPIVVIGQQRPDYRLPHVMEVTLIRQLFGDKAVYQLNCQFNNYFIKLPFSPKEKCYFRIGSVVPEDVEIFKKYFYEIDFSGCATKHNYNIKFQVPNLTRSENIISSIDMGSLYSKYRK